MREFSIFLYRERDGKDLNPIITDHESIEAYNADVGVDSDSIVITHQIRIEGPGADLLNAAIALTFHTQEVEETLNLIVQRALAIKSA